MRLGSDSSVTNPGWDVDDVTVQSCQPAVVDPNIDVSPLSMSATQATNTTTQQTLTVANTGGGTLNWTIAEDNNPAPPLKPMPVVVPVAAPASEQVNAAAPAAPAQPEKAPTLWQRPEIVLYDNGPLVTHPGAGAGGADASAVQTDLGMTTNGFGVQLTAGNRLADDFTISDPNGWTIDTITLFLYQSNSTTTSPITAVNLQIWDGSPDLGTSTVVFGDTTTESSRQHELGQHVPRAHHRSDRYRSPSYGQRSNCRNAPRARDVLGQLASRRRCRPDWPVESANHNPRPDLYWQRAAVYRCLGSHC